MPTDFCASLPPWLNASHADVSHCARSTRGFTRVVTLWSPRSAPSSIAQAAPRPSTGEIASPTRTPITPTGRPPPPTPPQLIAPMPASTTPAPTSPPTKAWLELDGSPRHQVTTFQATPAVRAAPTTGTVCAAVTLMIVAMVLATAAQGAKAREH
jgi:hypothetical protein